MRSGSAPENPYTVQRRSAKILFFFPSASSFHPHFSLDRLTCSSVSPDSPAFHTLENFFCCLLINFFHSLCLLFCKYSPTVIFYAIKDFLIKGYKKRNPYCTTKNAIKVSPFPCSAGCFHRTDDTANADFKRRLLPFISFNSITGSVPLSRYFINHTLQI